MPRVPRMGEDETCAKGIGQQVTDTKRGKLCIYRCQARAGKGLALVLLLSS